MYRKMKEILLFTTDDCPYCNVAESILIEVLNEYSGLFEYKTIKIDKNKNANILSLPTIIVGQKRIEGLPEKDQIHSALFS
jgi:glutaredoxin